jgi:hypothetical protein
MTEQMTDKPLFFEHKLNRWKRPESPKPGIAFVFSGDGTSLTVREGERGATQGEVLLGKYTSYYEVDMGDRSISFYEKLPCADAFEFQAEVRLTYAVSDPALIVRRGRADAGQFLKDLAVDAMRRTSRNYGHGQSGDAEISVARRVEEDVRDNGFRLCRPAFIKLSLDEAIRNRLVNRQLSDQDFEDQKVLLKRQSEIEELKVKQQSEIDGMKQSARFSLKGKKAEVLAPLIESGNWQRLLAMLDPHDPEDESIKQMIGIILDREKAQEATRTRMFEIAVEKGALEGWQLEDYAKTLFQEMSGISDRSRSFLEGKTNPQGDHSSDDSSPKPIPDEISRDEDP